MLDFIEGNTDVLVATTIVENGLDIPNANTIIINEAQNWPQRPAPAAGPRGPQQPQGLLLPVSPSMHLLAPDAAACRPSSSSLTRSGIHIAMKDLDIRGAGDMLGAEQSGFINDIAWRLTTAPEEAVQELKEEKFKELFKDEKGPKDSWTQRLRAGNRPELSTLRSYVSETGERLALYRELRCPRRGGPGTLRNKLGGPLRCRAAQVLDLFEAIRLRWVEQRMGFEKLVVRDGKMISTFIADRRCPFFQSEGLHLGAGGPEGPAAPFTACTESRGTLRLSVQDVKNVQQARKALAGMAQVAVG
ncbi:MAG: helicase-related protein [Flavobacteriales bacterium]